MRGLAAGVWNNPPAPRVELRKLVAAVAVAVLSQAVLWGTYAYATDGCFCAITGSTGFPTAAWIYPTLRVTSAPALWVYLPLPLPYLTGTLLNVAAVDGCHVRRAESGIGADARGPRRAQRPTRPIPSRLIAAGDWAPLLHPTREPGVRAQTFRHQATLETLALPRSHRRPFACEPSCSSPPA
jgi:hypothetical protein